MTNVTPIKPPDSCMYCGEGPHEAFTCPRIAQVVMYPSGTWSVILDRDFYGIEVDLDFDTDDDDPAA